MDLAGHEFLAGAAFPADEHGDLGGGHLADETEDALNLDALTEEPAHTPLAPQSLAQGEVLDLQPAHGHRASQEHAQLVDGDRFGEEVARSPVHRPQRVLARVVAGHHDDLEAGIERHHAIQKFEAALRIVSLQRQIEGDHIGALGLEHVPGPLRGLGGEHLVLPGQTPLELAEDGGLIVHDQNLGRLRFGNGLRLVHDRCP